MGIFLKIDLWPTTVISALDFIEKNAQLQACCCEHCNSDLVVRNWLNATILGVVIDSFCSVK